MFSLRYVIILSIIVFMCRVCAAMDLICSVEGKHGVGRIAPKDYATFNCSWTGTRTNNASDLDWFRIDSGEEPISSEKGLAIWRVDEDDNGVEFICRGQRVRSKNPATCSVTPLMTPVNVSITSLPQSDIFIVGDEASLTCSAVGVPYIAGYHWYKDGIKQTLTGRFSSSKDNQTIKITPLLVSDNGSVITCEAYVPSGLRSNASILLDIEEPPIGDGESTDDRLPGSGLQVVNLWILVACAAAGGIPVLVSMVAGLVWCVNKSRSRSTRPSKKRSQSQRHIVLNEEVNESQPQGVVSVTTSSNRINNGLVISGEDDGTNPPCFKPAPPPTTDLSHAVYVNTPSPSAATLQNLESCPTSPHYSTPRQTHQRKKTEYENVVRDEDFTESPSYENVAPNPISPRITLSHTSSLPNFVHFSN